MKKSAGFTLAEVLIGMMVLTVAIVTATNLLVGLVKVNRDNVAYLKAYYLAMEGIELARNQRDRNFVNGDDYNKDLNIVDMGEGVEVKVEVEDLCDGQVGVAQTPCPKSLITSTATFKTGSKDRVVELKTTLTDWKK